ncbi:hypothetical protein, partial [uncultured Dialister sp.]
NKNSRMKSDNDLISASLERAGINGPAYEKALFLCKKLLSSLRETGASLHFMNFFQYIQKGGPCQIQ